MANEIRARANLVSGTLSVALLAGDTTMSSSGLANLPAITSANHAVIVIENEIVYVTAHTASATTATILRAQEGTAAAAHAQNVPWLHGPVASDINIPAPFAWLAYTPTLTQSGSVTYTATYARYTRVGRMIAFTVDLTVTGTGTASNVVTVSMPVTAAAAAAGILIGQGFIYDSSAATVYNGNAALTTSSTAIIWPTADGTFNQLGTRGFTAALAAGDIVRMSGTYEAASD